MRALIVCRLLPYPLHDGGRIRKYHLAVALSAEHKVTLLAAAPVRTELEEFRALHPEIRVVEIPHRPERDGIPVPEAARQLLSREAFDVVQVSGFWQWPGEAGLGRARVVLDLDNLESLLLRRMCDLGNNRVSRQQVWATEALERRYFERADRVLACSTLDAAAVASLAPGAKVRVIPNGVDLESFGFCPGWEARLPPTLLYTGLLAYWPNADGSSFFAREVLPLVRAALPDARFRIVGAHPSAEVMALREIPGVEVYANVPDVRPFLADAALQVVPLRAGSGTRVKILESFASGLPVVSTSVGCEGLNVTSGRHLLVANRPAEIAAAVIRAVTDTELRRTMLTAARRYVEEEHGWTTIGSRLTACFSELEEQGA